MLNKSLSCLIALVLCFGIVSCTQNARGQETSHAKPVVNMKLIEKNAMAIRDKITKNIQKIAPEGVQRDSKCVVEIKLSETGKVLDATIIKSSGNEQSDSVIVLAIRNSSPLPMPRDQIIANEFRMFSITINET